MFCLLNFISGRQDVVEMALPACRILSLAVSAYFGPVENGLDAATQAAGGLGLG